MVVGMKMATLVRRSTKTRIESNPSEGGSWSMKSIEMMDQGCSKTGRGWSFQYFLWRGVFMRKH